MEEEKEEFNELALPPGAALRDYTIREVLGHGGFGITYLAHDEEHRTEVVIKEYLPQQYAKRKQLGSCSYEVIPFPSFKDDFERAKDRFIREAEILQELNHPNIVKVTEFFKELGTAYYVMPYVGGRSLDKVLNQEEPLPEERLRPMLCALLEALDYLHSKDLLHRDIKPDNILLDNEGNPILIDFGTARQLNKAPGTIPLGTPYYVPFEQTQTNGKLGPYSDIYSLGGTMYTLITGKKPEPSTDRVGNDPDPQTRLSDDAELRRRFSHDFLVSIDKALSVEKDNRWQIAEEWMKALNHKRTISPAVIDSSLPPGAELETTYTIREVLGHGGFGITYLAYDKDLEVKVVIKENMPKDFAKRKSGSYEVVPCSEDYSDWLERFIQEARTLAKLNHPNIVRVTRVFKAHNTAYYVMPYYEGGTSLDKVLNQEGPLPEDRLRPMLCALLEALDYLHRKDLLHRDIKPDNILLDNEGKPILIDFGTARQLNKAPGTVPLGTPYYVPFEQTQTNGKLGPYSDVYALGGTMYTLITGKLPVPSKDRVGEDPDPQPRLADDAELIGRYSRAFLKGIDKALSIEKDDRWQTAGEWTKALKSVARAPWQKVAVLLSVLTGVFLLFVAILSYESDDRPPLIRATAENRVEAVQNLLNREEPLEVKDSNGNTPLLIAAGEGFEAIVRLLLQKGANTEAQDTNGNTPLILASEKGYKTIVQLLLDRGANMEAQDANGNTPLIHASEKGHKSIVQLLLDKGANMEAQDANGNTPLIHASEKNHKPIVQLLLDRGANTGRKNKAGKTAYIAAQNDDIRQLFPKHEVHRKIAKRLTGSTKEEILIEAAKNGETDIAELLIDEYGVIIETKDKNGYTPLLWAAILNQEPMVRLLLEKGADIKSVDKQGNTALHWAAIQGHENIARLLVGKRANIDTNNYYGNTPLHWAAMQGHESIARLLIDNRANIEARTKSGSTPLIYASEKGHKSIVQLLLDRGANMEAQDANGNTPLIHASEKNHKPIVQLLLDRGANTGRKNKAGKTAYMVAQNDSIRQLFPEHNNQLFSEDKVREEIKERLRTKTKEELLIDSSKNGETAIVKMIIDEYRAEIESKDDNGLTPLICAAAQGHEDTARILMGRGAAIEAKDNDNNTPLMAAVKAANEGMVKLLLQRRANTETKDYLGDTPLLCAVRYGHTEIVKLLLENGADKSVRTKRGISAEELTDNEEIKELLRSY